MMEISNNIAGHFAALSGRNAGNAKGTAAQTTAQALPEQANIAATIKAGNSNFTPSESVQKEAIKWESFAEKQLGYIEKEIGYYNEVLSHDDAYWAEKEAIFGAEYVEVSKGHDQTMLRSVPLAIDQFKQRLTDNGFSISGTLTQENEFGELEFGNFTLSKEGLGFEFFYDSEDGSEIEYTRGRSSNGNSHTPKMSSKLQSLLFLENHR